MRKLILIAGIALVLSSCKSKQAALSGKTDLEIQQQEASLHSVPSKLEGFLFLDALQEAKHGRNPYFVILGSFKKKENADGFYKTLASRDFEPFILLSETGMHRVAVESYPEANAARMKVLEIREAYPQYHDCWMLEKKPF